MTKKNNNAKGVLNMEEQPKYEIKPDKEPLLWNPHSQVIYYQISESNNEQRAYLVAYNGYILDRNKNSRVNCQGYRCVKD